MQQRELIGAGLLRELGRGFQHQLTPDIAGDLGERPRRRRLVVNDATCDQHVGRNLDRLGIALGLNRLRRE